MSKPALTDAKKALIAATRKAENEKWEAALWLALRAAGIASRFTPQFEAIPGRKYRYDFACEDSKILVEVNGGLWMTDEQGRAQGHAHPAAIERDYEKLNAAVIRGWRVMIFSPRHVKDGTALVCILEALGIGKRA